MSDMQNNLIIIRGGGDIATGVAVRLFNSGYDILILETEKPSSIRRTVSLSQAVYDGEMTVEGVSAKLTDTFEYPQNHIPVMIDPQMQILDTIQPLALVDAIIAKKNLGLNKDLANIVIALGPGFKAGIDCHAVIETMRGHNLGRVIYNGEAIANTGTPGDIAGYTSERVLHASDDGMFKITSDIGSIVQKGDTIAHMNSVPVKTSIDGLVRGIINDGHIVHKGMKIADIDPRIEEIKNYTTISDKARAIGGSVLEAILHLNEKGR
ncbi:MAG: molybdenum hydroxylase [Denitrovibrio sp.]|nr:MAG: molybdenum hydroxylase [Denitrovibrio sp.]